MAFRAAPYARLSNAVALGIDVHGAELLEPEVEQALGFLLAVVDAFQSRNHHHETPAVALG